MQTVETPEIAISRALCRGTHFHAGAARHALLMVRFSRAAGEGLWLVQRPDKRPVQLLYPGFGCGHAFGRLIASRSGPRLVASVGGVIVGMGWALSALVGNNPGALIVTYGCLIGLGTGFGYVAPIATLLKWFPDKRGMMVGLAVMGIGVSPLVFAPLIEALIGKDPARFASTIPETFVIIAVISIAGVVGAAQFCKAPPAGWRPAGWEPGPASVSTREQTPPSVMLCSWQFYMLWLIYFLGASVGLTVISQVAPLAATMPKTAAALSAGATVGIVAVFNGVGRLIWGSVSDRLGRVRTMAVMGLSAALACGLLVRGAGNFWQLLAGLCVAVFAFGGFLALMPSLSRITTRPQACRSELRPAVHSLRSVRVPGAAVLCVHRRSRQVRGQRCRRIQSGLPDPGGHGGRQRADHSRAAASAPACGELKGPGVTRFQNDHAFGAGGGAEFPVERSQGQTASFSDFQVCCVV